MRRSRIVLPGILSACVALAAGAVLFADSAKQAPVTEKKTPHRESAAKSGAKSKARSKASDAATPGTPIGVPRPAESSDSGYQVDANSTITVHQNQNGDTVYSIAASKFDVSAPLRDMAANAVPGPAAEEESPTNPQLPVWRVPRSGQPDPVVQMQIPSGDFPGQRGFSIEAPTTGFNFAGVGTNGPSPSDSNGSVGNSQFVETVNVRYSVWSLDYSTNMPTQVIVPTSINTLWTTFGGPCGTQNSGDPTVLYDKVANRWLISQLTTGLSGGFYYQCVAVSTTADATGPYARWAFAVPGGNFGDYPHFGVWTDAYYMMAHGFTSATSSGTYVGGLFAAMDRPKMLAGNPAATWQVIIDPNEGGHMPADLDGFAPPPTNAPGVFLSIHGTRMYLYRMKVDFVTPANTVKTLQATMPIAPATGACALAAMPGTCIPQPAVANLLDSLGDRLMFRAAYRNFLDHESIVVSHSVDPSVTGLVSGVRWYDFRLSGTPDAVCPSYPCTYQQGTIADVANGRSRWMPSIAMDGAENILVGYSVSGKSNNVENQSIRYTGRAKGDPLGTMTVPEATIGTGTKNNISNTRWGDYTSMSVDPSDDCTFWYVDQYIPSVTSSWGTRIASATWPAGSGAGQCPVTTCTSRPASAPAIGSATAFGSNQIQVTWTGIAPQPGAYAIERALGACGSEGLYQPLAVTAGANGSFIDTTVQGGLTYSYRVIAATDAAGKCQALTASGCVSATATGTCNLKPGFAGATSASNNNNATCGVNVTWTAATSSCPLTPTLRYNIYRGTVPDFVPSPANRVATCLSGFSYLDTANVSSGVTYFYVVRAEDNSTGNGGGCGGGNEESNTIAVFATAYAPGVQGSPGTWTDGGGDGTALLRLNAAGGGGPDDQAWRFVKTANDAGANHTSGGAYAYRNAGPAATDIYAPNVCTDMETPSLTVGATTLNLMFWERHQIEYHWDGVAVEYSRNGGSWTDVPAPSNSIAAGCSASDTTTNWETLSCTGIDPANACAYDATKPAYNGPLASGTSCTTWATSTTVPAYAHRCHQITGLTPGDAIQFRWVFTSDPGAEYAGFYLDDIAITNIRLPNTCAPNPCGGQPDGTACSDGNACTQTDTCQSSVCVGGNSMTCSALDQCHLAGTCNPGTGTCSNPPATAGTACGDATSNACTAADTCDGAGSCQANNSPDGTACDDANPCTAGTSCTSGVCGGGSTVFPANVNDSVRLAGTLTTTITWTDPPGSYSVYRGTRSNGIAWAYNQTCHDSHIAASSATDSDTPAAGTMFFYLVTRVDACGESTPGFDSNGVPEPNPAPCP